MRDGQIVAPVEDAVVAASIRLNTYILIAKVLVESRKSSLQGSGKPKGERCQLQTES